MDLILDAIELRILGSLIEKEITTPEYYPMSLNALVNACNQKTNREPVMALQESEVQSVLEKMKDRRLVWQLNLVGGRVPKYEHNLKSLFSFSNAEIAVLCVLMLRGAQTIGEIRGRTERMHSFSSIDEVENVLNGLHDRTDGPFVVELPRRAGHKENRYMHLFSGAPVVNETDVSESVGFSPATEIRGEKDRIGKLEQEVGQLRTELDELRTAFFELKKQLE